MPLTPEEQTRLDDYKVEFGGLTLDEISRVQAHEEIFKGESGFFGRVGQDISQRAFDAGDIRQAYDRGEISKPREISQLTTKVGAGLVSDVIGEGIKSLVGGASALDKFITARAAAKFDVEIEKGTGEFGTGITRAISAFGSLPSIGGGTIGENIPKEIEAMSEAYAEWAQENPHLATDVEGAGNLLMVSPFFKYADDIITSTGKLSKIIPKNELKNLSAEEVKAKGTALFKLAEKKGGGVKKEFWSSYIDDMKAAIDSDPDIVKALVGGRDDIEDAFKRLTEFEMEGQSFSSLKKFRTALGDLAEEARTGTGAATNKSRIYENMKHSLEEKIMSAPDDLFVGGKKAAEMQREARKYWTASFKLEEIAKVISKAEGKAQPSSHMKSGMQRIRDNPKLFNRYTPKEQAAIKKAAKDGKMEGVVKTFGSRLGPVIVASVVAGGVGAGVGGPAGAALAVTAVTSLSGLARMAAEGMKLGKIRNVEDIIKLGASQGVKVNLKEAAKILFEAGKNIAIPSAPSAIAATADVTPETAGLAERARRLFGEKKRRREGNR